MTADDFFEELKDACTCNMQREVLELIENDIRVAFEEIYLDYQEEARKNTAKLKQMREQDSIKDESKHHHDNNN